MWRCAQRAQQQGVPYSSKLAMIDETDAEVAMFDPEQMYLPPAFRSKRSDLEDLLTEIRAVKTEEVAYQVRRSF